MILKTAILAAIILLVAPLVVSAQPLLPSTYGAIGDGVTDDRAAWQAMIADAQVTGRPIACNHAYGIGQNGTNGYGLLISSAIEIDGSGVRISDSKALSVEVSGAAVIIAMVDGTYPGMDGVSLVANVAYQAP